jgi:hypothetical protein
VSSIRDQLAKALSDLIAAKGQPIAQTARDLGYTRQRLHQLKSADRSAAPEAIEEAINKLGYEIDSLTLKAKGS